MKGKAWKNSIWRQPVFKYFSCILYPSFYSDSTHNNDNNNSNNNNNNNNKKKKKKKKKIQAKMFWPCDCFLHQDFEDDYKINLLNFIKTYCEPSMEPPSGSKGRQNGDFNEGS